MNNYKDFMKKTKSHETLLIVILILYIIFDIPTPVNLITLFNNKIFQVILAVLIFSLFFYNHPFICILATIAFIILIKRSQQVTQMLIPNETTKAEIINSFNKTATSVTLEEDMVQKMAPPVIENSENYNYQFLLPNTHNALNLLDIS